MQSPLTLTRDKAADLGWRLFALSWIPFIGIFSYVLYPVEEWLPPVSVVCLVLSLSMMIGGIVLILFSLSARTRRNDTVRQTGEQGNAVVLSVADSGTRINDHFVLNVGLRITPTFGPAFETIASQVVPIYHMVQIQKGNTVSVRYLQETREAVIEFD